MKLRGRAINPGCVEAEAIVSREPFSFLGDLEVSTGRVMTRGHDLEGQSIRGRIFVFPTGKGSTAGPSVAWVAGKQGNLPAGLVIAEAEPVIVMVALMNDLPAIHRLERDPLDAIRTGDLIRLDADNGVVEILAAKAPA